GIAMNTKYVGWGCGFLDFDNDGRLDLLLVNGHVFPEVERLKEPMQYRSPAILYSNAGSGRFEDISAKAGAGINEPHSARGAAFGDLDNNGSVEVLINNQNESPSLLKAFTKPAGHWLAIRLTGTRSNRSAIGARVKLTAGGRTQTAEVRSGGSYLSQSDLRLHFGLGVSERAEVVEIRWPGGSIQRETNVSADRIFVIQEK
ncbi:MAG: CRTAC1 family protein, partial [Bryobacteraceae bacterium]|nr:CRTAC1 family protein [Bryobacteraceae bacterium]